MILYHGSNQVITKIDLSRSKDFKDFGRGFYLTKDYMRAVAMAQRTTAIMGDGSPEVSPFIFNPSRCPSDVRIKKFDGRTAEWALFVLRNREKNPIHAYSMTMILSSALLPTHVWMPFYGSIVRAMATHTPSVPISSSWQNC